MSEFIDFQVKSVPEYLKTSVFYQTLNGSDDGDISLPAGRFKLDTSVSTDEELVHLLSTLQFWGSDEIPDELLDYFLKNDLLENTKILDCLEVGFPAAITLRGLNSHSPEAHMYMVLQTGSTKILRYLISRGYKLDVEKACVQAVKSRKVDFLQHVHQLGGLINIETASSAVQSNNLECFKYCMENGAPSNQLYFQIAAGLPDANILQFLTESGVAPAIFLGWKLCHTAIENDSLDCLKYLHTNGCSLHESLLLHAAAFGRLQCFQYLDSHECPRTRQVCITLARKGHLECLKYAHEQGFYWNGVVSAAAAEGGHLSTLQYAHENGCEWTAEVCNQAARCNHLPILRYASEHGCPWDFNATSLACAHNRLECLQLLHERGCPWDVASTRTAAQNGHLEVLQYLHANGCPWDTYACEYAAASDNLETLKYLHENDCPWNIETCVAAATRGTKRCLEYAITNGCEWDNCVYECANNYNRVECIEYLDVAIAEKRRNSCMMS